MVKVILLDWDGVISYSMKPIWMANVMTCSFFGKPALTYDEWYDIQAHSGAEFFRAQGFEGDLTPVFQQCYEYFKTIVEKFPPVMNPDAPGTLKYFSSKGLLMGIVSTHPETFVRKEIELYGLDKYFLSSAIVGGSVNKVEDIKRIIGEMGVESKDVLFIGDTVSDAIAARETGVNFIGVCGGYNKREVLENAGIKPVDRLSDVIDDMINL